MLIKREFFSEYVQFTLNIPPAQVDPHILNAENQDIIPKIGDQMYIALRAIFDTNPSIWSSATAYLTNDYVIIQNGIQKQVYKALANNTNVNPISSPATWQLSELGTFFENYLKPFGVFACYKEFLIYHGINITQFGLRVADETTSFAADGNTRAAMLDNARSRMNAYQAKFQNYLCDIDWTFDGIIYDIDCTVYKKHNNSQFKINAL